MISIKADGPVTIEAIALIGSGCAQPCDETGIRIAGASAQTENIASTIRDVTLMKIVNPIHLKAAAAAKIVGCYLENFDGSGILVENTVNPDHGDNTIQATNISSGNQTTAIGIDQHSSGGLRLINNKIIGALIGYRLAYSGTAPSSILEIVGNSIENQSRTNGRGIQLTRTVDQTFSKVVIGNNQITRQYIGLEIYDAFASPSANWLTSVSIVGNVFTDQNNPPYNPGYGIVLYQLNGAFITGNNFANETTGIHVTGGSPPVYGTNINIGGNTYVSVTTHIYNGNNTAVLCPPANCN